MRMTLWLCGALAALALVAGCGGDDDDSGGATSTAATSATRASTAPGDPTTAVLEAFERLRSSSFRATVSQTISTDAGDAPAQLQQALSAAGGTSTSEVEAERGSSRVQAQVETPQLPREITVVLYDGETFVSPDGSEYTRLGGDLGELFSDLADIGSEELGQALEDVAAEGPATVDGREVERYSATLSQEFTDQLVDRTLSGLGAPAGAVDLSVEETRLEIDLLPDGQLARQDTTTVIRIDLSELAGQDAVVTQTTTAEQTVRDHGAPITVQRPEASGEVTNLIELGQLVS